MMIITPPRLSGTGFFIPSHEPQKFTDIHLESWQKAQNLLTLICLC